MSFQENRNIPSAHPGHGQGPAGASLSDILTAIKNIVIAISNLGATIAASGLAQTAAFLQVQGTSTAPGVSVATLVKAGAGRAVKISVTQETGAVPAAILVDSANAAATAPVIYIAPTAVGLYEVNLPFSQGLVVIPGAGCTVTVSYS